MKTPEQTAQDVMDAVFDPDGTGICDVTEATDEQVYRALLAAIEKDRAQHLAGEPDVLFPDDTLVCLTGAGWDEFNLRGEYVRVRVHVRDARTIENIFERDGEPFVLYADGHVDFSATQVEATITSTKEA